MPGVTLMIDMPFPSYPDNFGHWAEALLPVYNVLARVRRRFTLLTNNLRLVRLPCSLSAAQRSSRRNEAVWLTLCSCSAERQDAAFLCLLLLS